MGLASRNRSGSFYGILGHVGLQTLTVAASSGSLDRGRAGYGGGEPHPRLRSRNPPQKWDTSQRVFAPTGPRTDAAGEKRRRERDCASVWPGRCGLVAAKKITGTNAPWSRWLIRLPQQAPSTQPHREIVQVTFSRALGDWRRRDQRPCSEAGSSSPASGSTSQVVGAALMVLAGDLAISRYRLSRRKTS